MMNPRPGIGIACALLSAAGFGLNPPIAAFLNAHGFVPVESVLVRSVVMIGVAGTILATLRPRIAVPRDAWLPLAGITLGTTGLSLCYLSSVAFIPVGLAVIIFYTFPLVVLVLSPWFEGERLSAQRIVLAVIAFSGLALAIGPSYARLDPRGIALACFAAGSAAAIFFSGRRLAGRVDEAVNAFWVHLLGLPVMVVAALFAGRGAGWFTPEATAVLRGMGMTVLLLGATYAASYLLMVRGLRHAPASRLTPFYNIEPVVSIAAAAVLVGERLDANQYVGGGLVIAALVASGVATGRARASAKTGVAA